MNAPLDHVKGVFRTPYEVALEEEVSRLRGKLAYYEGPMQMNCQKTTSFEPSEIPVRSIDPTLRLAVTAGYEAANGDGYHIFAVTHPTVGGFKVGYYISEPQLLLAADKAEVMRRGMETATRQLARMLGT